MSYLRLNHNYDFDFIILILDEFSNLQLWLWYILYIEIYTPLTPDFELCIIWHLFLDISLSFDMWHITNFRNRHATFLINVREKVTYARPTIYLAFIIIIIVYFTLFVPLDMTIWVTYTTKAVDWSVKFFLLLCGLSDLSADGPDHVVTVL